jgi:hypothetical protein
LRAEFGFFIFSDFSDFGFNGKLKSEAKSDADKSANGGANEDLKKGFHGLSVGGFFVGGFGGVGVGGVNDTLTSGAGGFVGGAGGDNFRVCGAAIVSVIIGGDLIEAVKQ